MLYWLNCQSRPRLRMRTRDEELRFWKFKECPGFGIGKHGQSPKPGCLCSSSQPLVSVLVLMFNTEAHYYFPSEHPNLKTRTSMMYTVKDNVSGHEIRAKTECLEKLKMCESNLHKSCQDSLPMFTRKNPFSSLII